ncbi:uncharacterized membrane-anchored protein YjiN (DUF445 family) [Kitasatospora sp. MAP12-15]|uniref:hypothetical protein n=1 Tax=unclassified Kitasatospora TaxID=2633591 RepID=UPI002476562F|nr:hypothetical protein [Kitasatospora sp. MAP12-44]MDH6107927.1 uncharacterized membrane-anchored protein YjiN (DUF445 family) [Kitasatospora sp. MAP12-44]
MTGRQQKAVVMLGAALVGGYVISNVAKSQARVLGLSAPQLAALTGAVAFVMRKV